MLSCDDGTSTTLTVPANAGDGLAPGRAQRGGLRLAATLGHRLGEVGEQHREPQEGHDDAGEEVLLAGDVAEVAEEQDRREDRCRPRRRTSPGSWPASRGSSLTKESTAARLTMAGSNSEPCDRAARCADRLGGRAVRTSVTATAAPRSGPRARAGKNVSPATMTIAPTTRPANSGESVGNVPAVTGTRCLRTSEPPMASAGMIRKKRPISIARPWVTVYQSVPVPWPANAEPLLLAAEAKL